MSQSVIEFSGNNSGVTTHGHLAPDHSPAVPTGTPRHADWTAAPPDQTMPGLGAPGATGAAPPAGPDPARAGAGRRTTVVLRYLLGRLAVDHFRRVTRWVWLVPVLGAVLLLVRPRWIGLGVIGLGLLLFCTRMTLVAVVRRVSLARRFRPVEDDLCSAVEAGKASLRVELRSVGLPSRSWRLALFATRLARGSARADLRSRLRRVDVDRVLPRAQLERALRLLDDATDR
jgi:hypothetical protein